MVLSEYWVEVFPLNLDPGCLVGVAACAMAAKFLPADVPMIVPKNIRPGVVPCLVGSLCLILVSHKSVFGSVS